MIYLYLFDYRGKENGSLSQCRYGVGPAFQEVKVGRKDFRRKKMFNDTDV